MFKELIEGLCNWNVVSKEAVMLYKFEKVSIAQVVEDLMTHDNN